MARIPWALAMGRPCPECGPLGPGGQHEAPTCWSCSFPSQATPCGRWAENRCQPSWTSLPRLPSPLQAGEGFRMLASGASLAPPRPLLGWTGPEAGAQSSWGGGGRPSAQASGRAWRRPLIWSWAQAPGSQGGRRGTERETTSRLCKQALSSRWLCGPRAGVSCVH